MSSKKNPVRKKVVVTTSREPTARKEKLKPTASRFKTVSSAIKGPALLYDWSHYRLMLIGVGLIALGLIFMLGGSMPSQEIWDEGVIYSFRRTTLAPGLIITGLLVEVYAIFKN